MPFQIHEQILDPSDYFIDERKFDLSLYVTVIKMMYGDRYKDDIRDLRSIRN